MLAQENPVMMPRFLCSPDWSGVPAFKVNTKPYVTQVYLTVMLRVLQSNLENHSYSNVTDQSGYLILNRPWITMNIYLTILDWFQMSSDFKNPLSEETSKHKNQELLPKGSGNPTTSQEWLSHLQWSQGNQS